ncbi:MAG: hypothetical protein ACRC6X_08110 [Culicoidibacterales bacterium]
MKKYSLIYHFFMIILILIFANGIKDSSTAIQVIALQFIIIVNLFLFFTEISLLWSVFQIVVMAISLGICYEVYLVSARISEPVPIVGVLEIKESALRLWLVEIAPVVYFVILLIVVLLTLTTCNQLRIKAKFN